MRNPFFVVMLLVVSGLFVACDTQSNTKEDAATNQKAEIEAEFWLNFEKSFVENCASTDEEITAEQQKTMLRFCKCAVKNLREQYPTMHEVMPVVENPSMMDEAVAKCTDLLTQPETEGE